MRARHVGLGPSLVDEDETGGIKPPLVLLPLRSSPGDVGAILLAGVQAFFFEADPFVLEKMPNREVTHFDPALGQFRRQRPKRNVGLLGEPPQQPGPLARPAHKAAGRQPCGPPRFPSRETAATTSLRWPR